MLRIMWALGVSYLLGSIPTGFILTKLLKGIDIRDYGSGNIGATNVSRILGKPAGILVLLIDIFKGFFATTLIADFFSVEKTIVRVIIAIIVVCGHNWTIFLRFRGGKGVATSIGAVAGLALKIPTLRPVFLLSIIAWLIIFLLFRIVALASLACALSLLLFMVVFKQPFELVCLGLIFCIFSILRHKSNIIKMLNDKSLLKKSVFFPKKAFS